MAASSSMETPDVNEQLMAQIDGELNSETSFFASAIAASQQVVDLSGEATRNPASLGLNDNDESPVFAVAGRESPLFGNEGCGNNPDEAGDNSPNEGGDNNPDEGGDNNPDATPNEGGDNNPDEGGGAIPNEGGDTTPKEWNGSAAGSTQDAIAPRITPGHWQLSAMDMIGVGFGQIEEVPVTCVKCKYPIAEPMRARKFGKQGGEPSFVCRLCGNIIAMVYKKLDINNLEESGLELSFLKGNEVESFFAQAKLSVGDDATLQWSKLRECLIRHFVERKVHRATNLISQEQLPLSVWAARGFDVEAIKRGKRCFPHPDFGEVWSTPLKTISHEQVTRSYLIPLVVLLGTHIWLPPLNSPWLPCTTAGLGPPAKCPWFHLISPPRSSCMISP